MKDIYEQLKQIAESAALNSSLFATFKDDLYRHDKDIVLNDFQPGDTWYWVIKQAGTHLNLADPANVYVQTLLKDAAGRRHFLIKVGAHDFKIQEYSATEIAGALSKVSLPANRKPKRRMAYGLLVELVPELRGSILFSDVDLQKGVKLYLNLTSNSVSYVSSTGKSRCLGLPFGLRGGAYKLDVTTEFGHGEIKPIAFSVYQRALKRANQAKTGKE